MNYVITVFVFLIVFSILVLVHEFGHFIMAKMAGIKVLEFGFGLPPRIWGKKKGETLYSINAIPFGGFVRMFGEDEAQLKGKKDKERSFAHQSMRKRTKVLVAGVLMNFLLAWFLISIGFSFGMEPLITPDGFLSAVNSGVIQLTEGVRVKSIDEGSLADSTGLMANDVIYKIDNQDVNSDLLANFLINPFKQFKVLRSGEVLTYEITRDPKIEVSGEDIFGVTFYDYVPMPRVKIYDLDLGSPFYKVGLRNGDIILSVNGKQMFSVPDYENLLRDFDQFTFEVYRNGEKKNFLIELPPSEEIIISRVLPDTPAQRAGLREGDIIISVNGTNFYDPEKLINFTKDLGNKKAAYVISRNGERIFCQIELENGRIGALLSELVDYREGQKISVYNTDLLSSIDSVKDEKYPVYKAIPKAFTETFRLSYLTAVMVKDFVGDIFVTGEVPQSVSGPVGIAQMVHFSWQEGFMQLLRLVAILSLSLAVVNILPFPALDGGRLLFVFVELILGYKINQKWESVIHVIGYGLILLLILAVTYSDLMRLFGF